MSDSTKQLVWIVIGIVLLLTSVASILIGEMCPARYSDCKENLKFDDGLFWFFIFAHSALGLYLISVGCKGILHDGKSSVDERKLRDLKDQIIPLVTTSEIDHPTGVDEQTRSETTANDFPVRLYRLLENGEINEDQYRRLLYDHHQI